MNNSIVKLRDFRKVYGGLVAVDSISFEVKHGEIFGLLGPNGAAKTSYLFVQLGQAQHDTAWTSSTSIAGFIALYCWGLAIMTKELNR